jgi:hypothetical protein
MDLRQKTDYRLLLVTLLLFALSGRASASMIFTGAGFNPEASANASGKAEFTISGNTLTLALTNTTSPRTTAQGNTLTGVTFDLTSADPVLVLTSIALSGGSALWTSETASNTSGALSGAWTNVLGSSPLGEYGVATTGFNGRFHGGSISLGNASPNYGIVAPGTFNGTNVPFGGSQFPFIQDTLVFTFTGIAGVSESQIAGVKFLFGTNGTGIVPEPATMGLFSVVVASATGFRRRSRVIRRGAWGNFET